MGDQHDSLPPPSSHSSVPLVHCVVGCGWWMVWMDRGPMVSWTSESEIRIKFNMHMHMSKCARACWTWSSESEFCHWVLFPAVHPLRQRQWPLPPPQQQHLITMMTTAAAAATTSTTPPHHTTLTNSTDKIALELKWYVLFLQQIQFYVTNFLLIPCHDDRLWTSQTAGKAQNTDDGDMGRGWDNVPSLEWYVFFKIKIKTLLTTLQTCTTRTTMAEWGDKKRWHKMTIARRGAGKPVSLPQTISPYRRIEYENDQCAFSYSMPFGV